MHDSEHGGGSQSVPVNVIMFVTVISQTTAYELGWVKILVTGIHNET